MRIKEVTATRVHPDLQKAVSVARIPAHLSGLWHPLAMS